MIYKHKLSFRNVSNDLCVTTHKYQAIWPQIIFTFSFMNPITLTFKCLKLHVTCLLLTHKTLNMREWIAWYPQIVLLAYMGFWGKFKPSSFCIQVSAWNKCVQMCVISYQYATLLRHISICPYRKHSFSFSNKSRDRQIMKKIYLNGFFFTSSFIF